MFDLFFFAIPSAILGYAATLFVIMKFMGSEVHDVSELPITHTSIASTGQESHVLSDARDLQVRANEALKDLAFVDSESDFAHIPTDSVLRRHYLRHLHTIATNLHPQPEDSILRRHHSQMMESLVNEMCQNPAMVDRLNDEALQQTRWEIASFCRPNRQNETPLHSFEASEQTPPLADSNRVVFPQDFVLRRHSLQLFKAQFETVYPRPSEITLLRHHTQRLNARLEALLEEPSFMAESL